MLKSLGRSGTPCDAMAPTVSRAGSRMSYRTGEAIYGKGGDAWVNTLTWAAFKELFFLQFFPRAEQERLKREYHSIRQRANENSTEYMQRFLRLAGFLGQAAGTAEEQAKNYRWGREASTCHGVLPFTDVAQVADAARNLEILRDREDYDRSEQSNKRHKSEDQYQPATQQSSYRSHGQNNDRHGSKQQGGMGWLVKQQTTNNNNNNNNNYSSGNNRSSGAGHDQRNRGQQFHRSTSSDSQQSRVPSEGYTHPVVMLSAGIDKEETTGADVWYANKNRSQMNPGRSSLHLHRIRPPILQDSARITHVYGDLPLQFDDKIVQLMHFP
ncbi:zinc finger, CCHC-type, retrotransposon gag domain protein [Tanacetum coccineum]